MFVDPVIVTGNGATAEIDILANFGIANIGQVAGLRMLVETGFFSFDKIADFVVAQQFGTGAQVRHGADFAARADDRCLYN